MTTRTSASLKQAFKRFVELVKPIEDVRHVVAFDDGGLDIFTYIRERDRGVRTEVFHAEYRILEEFPDLSLDFHVRSLEGRELTDVVKPLPRLVFSKQD